MTTKRRQERQVPDRGEFLYGRGPHLSSSRELLVHLAFRLAFASSDMKSIAA
jgi:hypothetical protein